MSPHGEDPARKHIVIEAADKRLKIMVSSATMDLPMHRKEATDAISRLGHTPVVIEHGSAEWNSDAIKFSLEKVEQSQVYLGIFALRYGYIPDDPACLGPDYASAVRLAQAAVLHALKRHGCPPVLGLKTSTARFGASRGAGAAG